MKNEKQVAGLPIKKEFEIDLTLTMKQIKSLVKQLSLDEKQELISMLLMEFVIKRPDKSKELLTETLEFLKTK